jgi:osmotically-inducible protein OsmY
MATALHSIAIKIVTVGGRVTLKGPVHTAAEKSAVVDNSDLYIESRF